MSESPAGETRWCSYRELVEAWGVALPAAKARVRRAGWRRQMGNDGVAKVEVPVEALAPQAPVSPTDRPTSPPTDPATDALLAELREARDQAREERDRARQEAEGLREAVVRLRERLARLEGEAEGREALLAELRLPWWKRLLG